MNTPRKWLHSAAAAAALVVLSSQAIAAEVRDPGQPVQARKVIETSDLDLSKAEDVQVLYERIRAAARQACNGLYAGWRYVERAKYSHSCTETAIERSVARAGQPLLTAIHEGAKERVARL